MKNKQNFHPPTNVLKNMRTEVKTQETATMQFIPKSKSFHWTFHARDKMRFYRLSEQRVRGVLHSPRRVEEGVAPKTVAMMQPASVKRVKSQESGVLRETWSQEIWVMVQHANSAPPRSLRSRSGNANAPIRITKIISAWRYPGMSKPRSEALKNALRQEYGEYNGAKNKF